MILTYKIKITSIIGESIKLLYKIAIFYNKYNIYIYSSNSKEKKIIIKYFIGWHKAITNVLHISHTIRCKVISSNKKASKWASHMERKNIAQVSIAYSSIVLSKYIKFENWNNRWGK